MSDLFLEFVVFLQDLWVIIDQSWWFLAIKIFFAIYSAVLIVNIVIILHLSGFKSGIRKHVKGMDLPISKRPLRKQWAQIAQRLTTGKEAQYKAAVLQADQFVFERLASVNYSGDNLTEQLAAPDLQITTHAPEVQAAHALRNAIIHDENMQVTREAAETALMHYKSFLEVLDLL